MGPSLFSDGRVVERSCAIDDRELQWGRRCSATEGQLELRKELRGLTSMGPSLFSDGRSSSVTTRLSFRPVLQWGRRCSATEGLRFLRDFRALQELQWGRRCSATEGVVDPVKQMTAYETSMGPSLFSDGRTPTRPDQPPKEDHFNGAVAVQRRKVGNVGTSPAIVNPLQWGQIGRAHV